ncbi:MAG: type II toxin-antitoxin system HicB family antitoxin [Acidobacteria bacterium]|nr:type II toxin-antitoxin system HicB family antitoxin [Acidobacteriota bacterium]
MPSYLAMIRNLDGGKFSVEYPDLPGCTGLAQNFPEARRVAGSLLEEHIRGLLAQGMELPAPRSWKELQEAGLEEGGFPTLIPLPGLGGNYRGLRS